MTQSTISVRHQSSWELCKWHRHRALYLYITPAGICIHDIDTEHSSYGHTPVGICRQKAPYVYDVTPDGICIIDIEHYICTISLLMAFADIKHVAHIYTTSRLTAFCVNSIEHAQGQFRTKGVGLILLHRRHGSQTTILQVNQSNNSNPWGKMCARALQANN